MLIALGVMALLKKTLYISDMDGTLLNRGGELSPATLSGVNHMIREGGLFALATARSPQSAQPLTSQLELNIPSVFINGVMLYDTAAQRPVEMTPVDVEVLPQLISIFEAHRSYGYMYAWDEGKISIFYNNLASPSARVYYEQRMRVYERRVYHSADYIQTARENQILYLVMYGRHDVLQGAYEDIRRIPQLNGTLYKDSYHDYYFIDIISSSVSKATGMRRLKELCGADEMVAFGDNYNDLFMLEAADRAYVPANGVQEAKEAADGVIGDCDMDGVVEFLLRDFHSKAGEFAV